MWNKRVPILIFSFLLAGSGSILAFWFITDMYNQISIKPQEEARALPENSIPVQGFSVPRGYNYLTLETALTPPPLTEEMKERGKVLYNRFCYACHGKEGNGDGPVAEKGMKPWWPLSSPQTQLRSDGYIFAHIWLGGPLMPPYRHALSVTETWELVAFVRSLAHGNQ
jgi:mono/diheme cytochrome c family protein